MSVEYAPLSLGNDVAAPRPLHIPEATPAIDMQVAMTNGGDEEPTKYDVPPAIQEGIDHRKSQEIVGYYGQVEDNNPLTDPATTQLPDPKDTRKGGRDKSNIELGSLSGRARRLISSLGSLGLQSARLQIA